MKKNIAAIIVSVFGIIGVAVAAPLYMGDGVSTIGVSGTNDYWTGSANWSSDTNTPAWQTWADGSDAIIKNTGSNNVAVNLSSSVTVQNMAWDTPLQGLTIQGTNLPTLTINGLAYTAQTTSRQFTFNAVNLAGNMAVSNISRFVLGSGTSISPGTTITNTDKTYIRISSGSSDMSGLTVRLVRGDGTLECSSNATVGTVTGFGNLGSATATNSLTINNLSIDNSGAIATMTAAVPVTLGSGTHTFLVKSLSGTNTASKLTGTSNVLGGTLAVQIAAGSDALKSGDVFTLFAGTNSGGFSSNNLPSLPPSLSWGTDKLVSRGLLYVTDGTFTPPEPQPPAWTGLTVFSDNFNDVAYNGTAVTNTRGWIVAGVPYWSTSAGVSNSGCFFLRNSTAKMSRYIDITSAATNSKDFRLKFDCYVSATTITGEEAGYVAITTDSGATWTTNFSLAIASTTNISYNLGGYVGPFSINIDTSGWTAGQLAGFGFQFSQAANSAADHFNVDNVLLSVKTNATATYTLTVNGGSGSGSSYTNGEVVAISANAPATGKTFDQWTGDTQYVTSVSSANTTVTMPAQAVALTATYKDLVYTLTGNAGANGTVTPSSTNVVYNGNADFVVTASNYYRIASLTTNGTAVTGMTFDNSSTTTNFTWSNVQAVGTLAATFTAQLATDPAGTPYSWLAGYGLTNYDADAVADQDQDGLKTWQEYIAGTDPTQAASCLKVAQTNRNTVTWSPVAGRLYSVYWSTNLVKGFTNLAAGITYPQGSWTNTTPDAKVNHYQVKVQLP